MYDWRKMNENERAQAVLIRRAHRYPDHSPPHWNPQGEHQYLISAACYEHTSIIGKNPERMTAFTGALLEACRLFCIEIDAWCVLPNHYHLLVLTKTIVELRRSLGQHHGRSSFQWNGEDQARGRKVWHNCFERSMQSESHYWVTINYIHHNPVKHGHVQHWQEWPWPSAQGFLEQMGRDRAIKLWQEYPILDYGKKWDL